MRRLMLPLVALACSAPSEDPRALLDAAIDQAGGVAALSAARALTWEGHGTYSIGRSVANIAGRWQLQLPDTAIVSMTYVASLGPSTTQAMVIASPRGWLVQDDRFTAMTEPVAANERNSFYLFDVIRLITLRNDAVSLSNVPPDSLGQRGFRAEQPGRPPVELFVDSTGRLSHVRLIIDDPSGGPPYLRDVWLDGELSANGIRWPSRMRVTLNGAQYFDLTMRDLRVSDRLADPLLAGPQPGSRGRVNMAARAVVN